MSRRPSATPFLLSVLIALSGCARSAAAPAGSGAAATAEAISIPFALCRYNGAAGTPCFPAHSDLVGRRIDPCYDTQRGRCERVGERFECKLYPISDGKPCTDGHGVCQDGRCQR